MGFVETYLVATWDLIAEMGPYLLLGFGVAGILHRLFRQEWIERKLGTSGFKSITLASVFGVPMPLCSCGVIPVTASLRDKGASKGAAASFLASTPQTGVDSILATWGMLGPIFATYRVFVAFISGLFVGVTVGAISEPDGTKSKSSENEQEDSKPSWRSCFRYGFITMPGDIAASLLIGFLLAGLISSLAPDNLLANLPGGIFLSILLTTLISTPFYICSTGSIPLALALIEKGLPVASALVLLVAGPATNIATIVTMRRILGNKETLAYVSCIVFIAWIAAYAFHLFLSPNIATSHLHEHTMALPWWKHGSGVLLLAVMAYGYYAERNQNAGKSSCLCESEAGHHESKEIAQLTIEGMTCTHCRESVLKGLKSISGAKNAEVDLASGIATVSGDNLDLDSMTEKIEGLGFTVSAKKLQKA